MLVAVIPAATVAGVLGTTAVETLFIPVEFPTLVSVMGVTSSQTSHR